MDGYNSAFDVRICIGLSLLLVFSLLPHPGAYASTQRPMPPGTEVGGTPAGAEAAARREPAGEDAVQKVKGGEERNPTHSLFSQNFFLGN